MSNQASVALQAAAVCEVVWRDASGQPDACAATPLLWEDTPTVAFTFAAADTAHAIADSKRMLLTLTDGREATSGWKPWVLSGRPHLVVDEDGTIMREHLLEQELRKYPPSRTLADSLLLQREHWWYLPRLLVTLDVDESWEFTSRQVEEALVSDGEHVSTVHLDDHDWAADLTPGPAVALCHDFSAPDMERHTTWKAHGAVECDTFVVDDITGSRELPRPHGLWTRLRRQHALSKACRRRLQP